MTIFYQVMPQFDLIEDEMARDLVSRMLKYLPDDRSSISDLLTHSWFNMDPNTSISM